MIMQLLATINPEQVTEEEAQTFTTRLSARAVVFDQDGLVGLLHVSNKNYYKLPGGGIEAGEDIKRGLERECEEEIGCDIEIGEPIGEIHEYRRRDQKFQISHIYFAKVVDPKRDTNFTTEETEEGFVVEWQPFAKAIELIEQSQPLGYTGQFVHERDTLIMHSTAKLRPELL